MEKRIMRTYFENAGRLVCYRQCPESRALSDQVLDLVIDVMGRPDLRVVCKSILRETEMLQSVADCALLGAKDLPVSERVLGYLGMKAECLELFEVQVPKPFDREQSEKWAARAALQGERMALRLGACLDWLAGNQERAVRCWTLLAYTGEPFSMQALEYALTQMGDGAGAQLWVAVRRICEETDSRFSMAVDKRWYQDDTQPAAETAQLILAVRNRCAELQQKTLPIGMLQYVIDSEDDTKTKIRNLYNAAEPYPLLLVKEQKKEKNKFGF